MKGTIAVSLILFVVIVVVQGFPQPTPLRPFSRHCCTFYNGCGDDADQYWYLYIPADVQFNCEDIIDNDNRDDFYTNNVHPDFSGYAWEIYGCHIGSAGCDTASNAGGRWCSEDDGDSDPCDDDDFGGGSNTWIRRWSDTVTRNTQNGNTCPYQYTVTREWVSDTTCLGAIPPDNIFADQLIYVVDQRPPNLAIPADLTIECPTNYVPDYVLGQAEAVDLCTVTSVSYTSVLSPSGACNAGTLRRTFTGQDRCGNSVQQVQEIEIVDTTPPIIPQLPAVTTTCTETATSVTGEPGNVPYFSCETFIVSGPSFTDFPTGSCSIIGNTFGCNRVQAGTTQTFTLVAPSGRITVEFNHIRLTADPRLSEINGLQLGVIRVYDGINNSGDLLQQFDKPPGPDPIISSTGSIYVEYIPNNPGDTTIIDGFSGFYYGNKTTPNLSTTATVQSEEIIPGPCEGTYTMLRTWQATDECSNVGTMTQTIFVVDNTPPTSTNFPQTNIIEHVNCLSDFVEINPAITDECSLTGTTLTKQVSFGGASGQNFAFSIVQTFTATDGCDNSITWTYTQEIGYYPIYISDVTPPFIENAIKGTPFSIATAVALVGNAIDPVSGGGAFVCTAPVVVVADAGPALLSVGSDPCWTQAANGLLYCDTVTDLAIGTGIDLVLTVPTDYVPNSIIISFTVAERTLAEFSLSLLFSGTTTDNVIVTFSP